MIVQISEDLIFVDTLKDHTGLSTASKAFKFAARQYLEQTKTIELLEAKLRVTEAKVAFYSDVITQARNSASLLVDATAQHDLLNEVCDD
jgi:hypothetical protein